MKKHFLYIAIASMLFAVFSCSNEFINDNINSGDSILSGDLQIFLSPAWEIDDYHFTCPSAENADFTVKSTPKWLEVETTTGKLTKIEYPYITLTPQSEGTIRCKASKNPDFEKTGIYLDKIEISVSGKTYYIPVAYISEGNPKIEVNPTFTINYNSYYSHLNIRNTGNGILLWDIVSMPEWLVVDMQNLNIQSVIVPQNNLAQVSVTLNPESALSNNLSGIILLKTNDKDNPTVTINVTANMGSPEISMWLNNNQIDFGTTVYLKSNASNNPSIAITVTARAPGKGIDNNY